MERSNLRRQTVNVLSVTPNFPTSNFFQLLKGKLTKGSGETDEETELAEVDMLELLFQASGGEDKATSTSKRERRMSLASFDRKLPLVPSKKPIIKKFVPELPPRIRTTNLARRTERIRGRGRGKSTSPSPRSPVGLKRPPPLPTKPTKSTVEIGPPVNFKPLLPRKPATFHSRNRMDLQRSEENNNNKEIQKKQVKKRMGWRTHGYRDGRPTFGVVLKPDDEVPLFLVDSFEFLGQNPRSGIFRVCGSQAKMERSKIMINEGREINLKFLDVANVSGLVKLWCREYPGKWLDDFRKESNKIMSANDFDAKKRIKEIIYNLPVVFKEILNIVIKCCYELAKESDVTKLSSRALSVCIAPAIFHYGKGQLADIACSNAVFQTLIDNYPVFFPNGLKLRERKPEMKNYIPPKSSKIKLSEDEMEDQIRGQMEERAVEYMKVIEDTFTDEQYNKFRRVLLRSVRKPPKCNELAQELFNIFQYKNKELMIGFQSFLNGERRDKFVVAADTLIRSKELNSRKYVEMCQKALEPNEFKEFELVVKEFVDEQSKDFHGISKYLMGVFYKIDQNLLYGFQCYVVESERMKFTEVLDSIKRIEDEKALSIQREKDRIAKRKEKIKQKVLSKSAKQEEKRLKKIEKKKKGERQTFLKKVKEMGKNLQKLHNLIRDNKMNKVLSMIENNKISVNGYYNGLTPLHWCVFYERTYLVNCFLDDPDVIVNCISLDYPSARQKEKSGVNLTPLMVAVKKSNKKIVRILINHQGIDLKVTSEKNKTAEQMCTNKEIKRMLKNERIKDEREEKRMEERMKILMNNYSDFTIYIQKDLQADPVEIKTLKFILMRSKYLADIIKRDQKIFEEDQYTVQKVLDFLAGNTPKIRKSMLWSVFKLSEKWKVYNLMYIVLKKIQEKIYFKDLMKIFRTCLETEEERFRGSAFELACLIKFKTWYSDQITNEIKTCKKEKEKAFLQSIEESYTFLNPFKDRIIDHLDLIDLTKREMSTRELFEDYLYVLLKNRKFTNLELMSSDYEENIQAEILDVQLEVLMLKSEYFIKELQIGIKEGQFVVKDFNFEELKRFLKLTYSGKPPKDLNMCFKFLKYCNKEMREILLTRIHKKSDGDLLKTILKYGYHIFRIKEIVDVATDFWDEEFDHSFFQQLIDMSDLFVQRINELKGMLPKNKK